MFGHNEIVGKRAFPDDDKLLVTSIFVTMQGEGPFSGMPAVFVRLAKCNLACSFCDTYFDSGDWLTFDELDTCIDDLLWDASPVLDKEDYVLIITGGEPMLQKALVPYLYSQDRKWRHVQIESNGIIVQDIPAAVTLVVSPKCLEKDGRATRYIKPNPKMLERADHLKFVMESNGNSPYSKLPDWAFEWARGDEHSSTDIFVSPMNVYNRAPKQAKVDRLTNQTTLRDRSEIEEVISFWEPGLLDLEVNRDNHEYTARYAVRHGLRFQVQAHLYAGLA
ncbi:QueE-like radical SAM domain [Dinoroseobacter phage vB_DshS-R5C]|uniref:Radical SAM protein n=1 Tax=Dinoroseobacter phage vB_DshS-R5C TaxID=1965368 RepID=A0A1V0DYC7_9CAUD|nr:QueE-like radical SAM domain [Dinoroseobacter phage vB_DshS-R5C]ARB06149.1 radical SAM protein [Dinoroseobacter phage vB_DshS-R5C]